MTSVRHLQKANVPFSINLFGRRDWGSIARTLFSTCPNPAPTPPFVASFSFSFDDLVVRINQ